MPQQAFGRTAPVVLEVGCGHGAAALAYAAAHPDHDLLAVDVFTPALARMLAEADHRGLTNLWVHEGDAVLLLTDRVGRTRWPRCTSSSRTRGPRPSTPSDGSSRSSTLDLVADRLAPGGRLLLATDHDGYAAHVRSELAGTVGSRSARGSGRTWRPTDGFEAKGLAAGRRVSEFRCTPL